MNLEALRQHYLPDHISMLFVAEAPPDSPDRFFYNPDVATHDWLYLGLMKVLYADALPSQETAYLRAHKKELLETFQADGYYLVDAIDDHVAVSLSSLKRTAMIRANASAKADMITSLLHANGDVHTRIILIKSTVYAGLFECLRERKLPVVNKSAIPFPSTGQQKAFAEQLARTLSD